MLKKLIVMIRLKQFSLLYTLLLIVVFTACSTDDNNTNYKVSYTLQDLEVIHNGDSKSWNLEAHYNNYNSKSLNSDNACFIDEKYIFLEDGAVDVLSGDINCFADETQTENTIVTYIFNEDNGSVYIRYAKNAELNEVTKSIFFSLQLVELEENLMIFAAGDRDNYGKALVFRR